MKWYSARSLPGRGIPGASPASQIRTSHRGGSDGGRPRRYPERLIADRGYDSNATRASLKARGVEPIIPCGGNNTQATDQDGRRLGLVAGCTGAPFASGDVAQTSGHQHKS